MSLEYYDEYANSLIDLPTTCCVCGGPITDDDQIGSAFLVTVVGPSGDPDAATLLKCHGCKDEPWMSEEIPIDVTLTGDTWVASDDTFDAQSK